MTTQNNLQTILSIMMVALMAVFVFMTRNQSNAVTATSEATASQPSHVTHEAPQMTVTQAAPHTTVTQEAQSVNQTFYFNTKEMTASQATSSKPSSEAPSEHEPKDEHHNSNIIVPKIKQSSLSYLNSAGRVGFDFDEYYNDFTNEGHMYPVHGVGDLDKTRDLMAKFIKSAKGEPFDITDLGIQIQVTDYSLKTENPFFDFHSIPTRLLDGSTMLADGSRVEQHIEYFTGEGRALDPLMKIDWISGNAKLADPENDAGKLDIQAEDEFPTTLASTRATPHLKQDEYLALTFFSDGKQNRVNNNSTISNWRYVVPNFVKAPIFWFVAKAYVPCDESDPKAEQFETTDGSMAWGRPRTADETNELKDLHGKNRLMKTVSKVVKFEYGADKMQAFNQRYRDKMVDFGDIIVKDVDDIGDFTGDVNPVIAAGDKKFKEMMDRFNDKQIAFQEMIHLLADKMIADDANYTVPKVYQVDAFKDSTPDDDACMAVWQHVMDEYLNEATYSIGHRGLNNKAQLPKSWLPGSVGETGWLVVDAPSELVVPDEEEGEFFIGWSISTQPHNDELSSSANDKTVGSIAEKLAWTQANGYASAQGPGLMFLSSEYGSGTQEPFLLEASQKAVQQEDDGETEEMFKQREKLTLPQVHWRLDAPDVIFKSLEMGAVTQTNVGHNQRMLVSIGSKTHKTTASRSRNFFGRYYQDLLADRELLQLLKSANDPTSNDYQSSQDLLEDKYGYKASEELYEILNVSEKGVFIYSDQKGSKPTTYY